jgi:hypothetical protein
MVVVGQIYFAIMNMIRCLRRVAVMEIDLFCLQIWGSDSSEGVDCGLVGFGAM